MLRSRNYLFRLQIGLLTSSAEPAPTSAWLGPCLHSFQLKCSFHDFLERIPVNFTCLILFKRTMIKYTTAVWPGGETSNTSSGQKFRLRLRNTAWGVPRKPTSQLTCLVPRLFLSNTRRYLAEDDTCCLLHIIGPKIWQYQGPTLAMAEVSLLPHEICINIYFLYPSPRLEMCCAPYRRGGCL